MSVPQLLKPIALPILAIACVLVALPACGNASANVSARVSQDSGEPTCKKPDGQSIEVSSNAGTAGRLGTSAGLEGEEGVTTDFLKLLGEGALDFGEEKGLGWLLSVVSGQQEELDPAHVDEQFAEVNRKLDALGDQQYEDCQALVLAIHQAKVNDDMNSYSLLASQMSDQIGLLETYSDDFNDIVGELQSNGGDIDALNDTYKDDLRAMIEGTKDGLLNIINTINIKMAGNSPGATRDGLVLHPGSDRPIPLRPVQDAHLHPGLPQRRRGSAGLLGGADRPGRVPLQQRRSPGLHGSGGLHAHKRHQERGAARQPGSEGHPALE
jgi:hypothetical protein